MSSLGQVEPGQNESRRFRRDQRAVCFAARAARRSVCLLDDARSTSQIRALVTSGNELAATAAGFRLRLGGGRCAPASFR
jgi:hypothetical protein